jgi:hypothetical protein
VLAEELTAALAAQSPDDVVAALLGRTEDERRTAAPSFWEGFDGAGGYAHASAVVTAVGIGSLTELKKHKIASQVHRPLLPVAEVLDDRRPPWLADWIDLCLSRHRRWGGPTFPLAWLLFRRGAIERPKSDAYVLELLHSWGAIAAIVAPGERIAADETLRRAPELLEWELWRLFEVEGRPRVASLTTDGGQLLRSLPRLVASGDIGRDRLIQAALGALSSGFSAYNNRWFVALLGRLDFSAEDVERHAPDLLRAMASGDGPTAAFVANKISAAPAGAVDTRALIDAAGAVIPRLPKAGALESLKLVASRAKSMPETSPVLPAVAGGLTHPDRAVQAAAITLASDIAPTMPPDVLASALMPLLDHVAASLRPRVQDLFDGARERLKGNDPWLGLLSPTSSADTLGAAADVAGHLPKSLLVSAGVPETLAAAEAGQLPPPWVRRPAELPSPAPDPVEPLRSSEEVGSLLLRLLEDASDPIAVEQAIDGLGRFRNGDDWDFGAARGPLVRRVRQLDRRPPSRLYDSVSGTLVRSLAVAIGLREHTDAPHRLLAARIAEAVLSRVGPALACPTHRSGWVDPRIAAERLVELAARGSSPGAYDLTQLLLRIAPWRRDGALAVLGSASLDVAESEAGRALRRACGDESAAVGPTAAVWLAAAAGRAPLEEDPALAQLLPEHPQVARSVKLRLALQQHYEGPSVTFAAEPPQPRWRSDETPSVARLRADETSTDYEPALIRAASLMWPGAREVHAAHGMARISSAQRFDLPGLETWLEPLADPDYTFAEMSTALLLIALAAKAVPTRAAAIDTLAGAVEDGRLVGPELGDIVRRVAPLGAIQLSRLAGALEEAARLSGVIARAVRLVLETALALEPQQRPRGVGDLAALLHELVEETGGIVGDSRLEAWLRMQRGNSKSAQAARAILARSAASDTAAINAHVAAARVARAARWSTVAQAE